MLNRWIRPLVPPGVLTWRRRQLLRRKARELAALDYPELSFAALYRASRANGWFMTFQVEEEIVRLLEEVHRRRCQTLLEIGTAAGGTLFLLTRAADRHATIVTLDLDRDPTRSECLAGFARRQQRIVPVQGNSNSEECAAKVRALLAGRPLDFLLIDGDHSAYAVRKDFELYGPLVAPGGLVALHDICLGGGVKEFWAQVKNSYRSEELIGNPNQQECGIGLLHV